MLRSTPGLCAWIPCWQLQRSSSGSLRGFRVTDMIKDFVVETLETNCFDFCRAHCHSLPLLEPVIPSLLSQPKDAESKMTGLPELPPRKTPASLQLHSPTVQSKLMEQWMVHMEQNSPRSHTHWINQVVLVCYSSSKEFSTERIHSTPRIQTC